MINKGDKMLCDLLKADGKRTGEKLPVTVLEVRRHHMTQSPQSVRVRAGSRPAVWVQPQYLHASTP